MNYGIIDWVISKAEQGYYIYQIDCTKVSNPDDLEQELRNSLNDYHIIYTVIGKVLVIATTKKEGDKLKEIVDLYHAHYLLEKIDDS